MMCTIDYFRIKRHNDAISRDHSQAKQVQTCRACFNASSILDYITRNIHPSKYCVHIDLESPMDAFHTNISFQRFARNDLLYSISRSERKSLSTI